MDQADWNTDVTDNIAWLATSRPHVSCYKSGTQSINNTTYTAVTFDTEAYDTGACHSTSSNTSRLTVPSGGGGLYEIWANIDFASNATGFRYAEFYLNGATVIDVTAIPAVNGTVTAWEMNTKRLLSAGDYVELRVYQNSGGALNITGGQQYTKFGFDWVATA
jgi:hypothetical protein